MSNIREQLVPLLLRCGGSTAVVAPLAAASGASEAGAPAGAAAGGAGAVAAGAATVPQPRAISPLPGGGAPRVVNVVVVVCGVNDWKQLFTVRATGVRPAASLRVCRGGRVLTSEAHG